MVKARFAVDATSYMDHVCFHLYCTVEDGRFKEVPRSDLAAYIVNKYAKQIRISEYGYGYEVDLPQNAVLALEYSFYAEKASFDELDEIAASGRTRLHSLREELGFPADGISIQDLFLKDAGGKGFSLSLRGFPKLLLYADGGSVRVEFNAEAVDRKFLKRALHGGLEEAEVKMLRGITVLGKNAQAKYMQLLSERKLSVDEVAKAVLKSAVQAKNTGVWLAAADWLKANGYGKQASEVIAKKTICS